MDGSGDDVPLSAEEAAALREIVETLAVARRMMEGIGHERLHDLLTQASDQAERILGTPLSTLQ